MHINMFWQRFIYSNNNNYKSRPFGYSLVTRFNGIHYHNHYKVPILIKKTVYQDVVCQKINQLKD